MRWWGFILLIISLLALGAIIEPGGGGVEIIHLGVGDGLETIEAKVENE